MYRREPQSLSAGRNIPVMSYNRNVSGGSVFRDSDENLDLFSRNRRASSLTESDVLVKLERLSAVSVKLTKSGMDDLLTSTDGGKNDYDWLLTPPGTPIYPSVDRTESQQPSMAPRSRAMARSVSTSKGSRLQVSQPESTRPSRPARSSSVTRPSVSTSQFSTYSSKSSSILNTSSASVSSYIRPSTPSSRSSSSARPSTPSPRPVISRPSTPSKARPSTASSSMERTRPVQNSRPSTPTSRPHVPANSNIPSRSLSRPSTPTRRNSAPPLSQAAAPSSPAPRSLSRPSSPSPRVRAPPQPMILPDFSLETPPNLRTTLPDRPLSASRSRPGVALTAKGNEETSSLPVNVSRRAASPVVSRGRMVEPPLRARSHANGQGGDMRETRKLSNGSETLSRRPVRPSQTPTESTGFGRTISKKSLDMAMKHMDIKSGTNGVRPLSGTVRFPQSIRSTNPKALAMDRSLSSQTSAYGIPPISNNGANLESGSYFTRSPESCYREENRRPSAKLTQVDIYESSRYDTILLKEDLKNTNWLLNVDDNADQGPNFDHGFEPLPELFDP